MAKQQVTRFRWFWAWQDEAEERWLAEMSGKGFHLNSVGIPGIYTFQVAEPRSYVYRMDYQSFTRKDKKEYLQLYQDAGWEYIGELSAWQYFRKELKPGEVNEIFTDVESKIAKYNRALVFTGFMIILLLSVFGGQVINEGPGLWWGGIKIFYLVVIMLLVFAVIKLSQKIKRLKRN